MSYICSRCKEVKEGNPVYWSYGLYKGKPKVLILCSNCKEKLTDEEVKQLELENIDK